eukprot:GILK01007967.1.p1 GENE.GILK01007967.1~~GILK01007967.1.p1  ORF type:complete len:693 (-),score=154.25 GILK01007967.1:84-1982(-)
MQTEDDDDEDDEFTFEFTDESTQSVPSKPEQHVTGTNRLAISVVESDLRSEQNQIDADFDFDLVEACPAKESTPTDSQPVDSTMNKHEAPAAMDKTIASQGDHSNCPTLVTGKGREMSTNSTDTNSDDDDEFAIQFETESTPPVSSGAQHHAGTDAKPLSISVDESELGSEADRIDVDFDFEFEDTVTVSTAPKAVSGSSNVKSVTAADRADSELNRVDGQAAGRPKRSIVFSVDPVLGSSSNQPVNRTSSAASPALASILNSHQQLSRVQSQYQSTQSHESIHKPRQPRTSVETISKLPSPTVPHFPDVTFMHASASNQEDSDSVSIQVVDSVGTIESQVDEQESSALAAWQEVSILSEAEIASRRAAGNAVRATDKSTAVTYAAAYQHYYSSDLRDIRSDIQTSDTRHLYFFQRLCAMGLMTFPEPLQEERDILFAIAKVQFNNDSEMDNRVLQTIYKRLTGNQFNCPRFGTHWEVIGFQRDDPATDLRGVGMLGLLHLLAFINQHMEMVSHILILSQDPVQHFPFAATSMNISKIALEALREGRLTALCRKRKEVMRVVNDFYMSTFHRLYAIWKKEQKRIEHFGFVLRDLSRYCKSNPTTVITDFQNYSSKKINGVEIEDLKFTDLDG